MTDCCILNSAFDASNHNYGVIVVRDCVAGTNDELEDAALKMISLNLGLVDGRRRPGGGLAAPPRGRHIH